MMPQSLGNRAMETSSPFTDNLFESFYNFLAFWNFFEILYGCFFLKFEVESVSCLVLHDGLENVYCSTMSVNLHNISLTIIVSANYDCP